MVFRQDIGQMCKIFVVTEMSVSILKFSRFCCFFNKILKLFV